MTSKVQETLAYPGTGFVSGPAGGGGTAYDPVGNEPYTKIGDFGGTTNLTDPSGAVASRQYPGVWWAHRDENGVNIVYAYKIENGLLIAGGMGSGVTFKAFPVNVTFQNAEDICTDDLGNLWVQDVGNNNNNRANLRIYKFVEPDPFAASFTLAGINYPITWPVAAKENDGTNPDCECMFDKNNSIYLISKRKPGVVGAPRVCRLPSSPSTSVTNTLVYICDVTKKSGMPVTLNGSGAVDNQDYRPTGVDRSKDNEYLAIAYPGYRMVLHQSTNSALTGDAWVTNVCANPVSYKNYNAAVTWEAVEAVGFSWTFAHDLHLVSDASRRMYYWPAEFFGATVPSSIADAFPAVPTAGNTLVAIVEVQTTATTEENYTPPSGQTWVLAGRSLRSADVEVAILYRYALGLGTEQKLGTWSNKSATRDIAAQLVELEGIVSPSAVLDFAIANGSSLLASTGTTDATSDVDVVAVGAAGARNDTTLGTPTNGFTSISTGTSPNATAANRVSWKNVIKETSGATGQGSEISLTPTRPWAGLVVVFQGDSGVSSQTITPTGLARSHEFGVPQIVGYDASEWVEVLPTTQQDIRPDSVPRNQRFGTFMVGTMAGRIPVWDGSQWVLKPVKVWDGTKWVQKPAKKWTGTQWVATYL